MKNTNNFTYNYSAQQNSEIELIRKKYMPREESGLSLLKKLDARAQRAGRLEALTLGIMGSLVFGIGMCFGLDVFPGADWLTLLFMGIGTLMMLPAYPLFKCRSKKVKEKLKPEILRLSEEIMKE